VKTAILNGNELIIQGGLEAGFSLYTGYPGSPLADYFNILFEQKQKFLDKGIKVVIANSEANAAAMASGAKQAGRDTLVAMKSMGLHVAADALSVGNFADPGPKSTDGKSPGVVVVVGDDPWSISTSTAADSRYLFKHLHIPFLEPSTPQELKDWMKAALEISRETSIYQGLLLTTFMAEGGGRVELFPEVKVSAEKVELNPKEFNLQKNVMVPPNSLLADVAMINERFPRIKKAYLKANLDKRFGNEGAKIGIISSGIAFETLKQVLDENQYLQTVSLYKIASSYPLIEDTLVPYLTNLDHLIVVEEKRGFLENELYELIGRHGLAVKVYGKKFSETEMGFPSHGGLTYEVIKEKCESLLNKLGVKQQCLAGKTPTELGMDLPKRLPTFYPGYPHRETLSLLKELRTDLDKKGIKLISHGDVGCYSLSFLPPFKEMHNLSAMGQGGALGSGVDMFTTNPSVVLMGDSTFYHSDITDISNSVQMSHTITYILLDNDNTAMTGHQVSPSTGISVDGSARPVQNMLAAVQALGVQDVIEVNPSDRYFYKNTLGEWIERSGVKVIISNKECGLTFHGRKKSVERKKFANGETLPVQSFFQINPDVCEDCRACVDMTGCPGLTLTDDAYGSKVMIDPQICVSDSYCTKIKACPSFERVDVLNYHPTKYKNLSPQKEFHFDQIPLPKVRKSLEQIASGQVWRAVVTGVGGSGVTTISKVLSRAALEMGGRDDLDFKFVDQKGLAQRNGNVTGHLVIYPKSVSQGPVTPIGGADCLMSPDLLDGPTHLKFLSDDGLLIVDDHFQVPLTIMLDQKKPMTREALISQLEFKLSDRLRILPLKSTSAENWNKSVYASAMILGAAFQLGMLPFSLENLKEAFNVSMKKSELETNWQAFQLGRQLTLAPQKERVVIENNDEKHLLDSIKESALFGPSTLEKSFVSKVQELTKLFPQLNRVHLSQYVHDILLYDRGSEWKRFYDTAVTIANSPQPDDVKARGLRIAARTFWIKDEVFVAHKMVSSLQKRRDQEMYSQLGTSFDVVHINRPRFDLFGKKIEFDISPKDWMLKLMRHARFLRLIMPSWHTKEKQISQRIRNELVTNITKTDSTVIDTLINLENIKGYREIRYQKAKELWGV